MGPAVNRITESRLSGNFPPRGEPIEFAPDMNSQAELVGKFLDSSNSPKAVWVEDVGSYQVRHGERLREDLLGSLFQTPDQHDLSPYDTINVLAAYRVPGAHTLGGKIPDKTFTLVEIVSPIGFWVWPELKSKETPDVLSLDRSVEETQPILMNGAVGFVIEELGSSHVFARPMLSRAAFKEMIISAAADEVLLPEQYFRRAKDAILAAAHADLSHLISRNSANLIVTDSCLLFDRTLLKQSSEARLDLTVHTLKNWRPSTCGHYEYPLGDFSFTIRLDNKGEVEISLIPGQAESLQRFARFVSDSLDRKNPEES